MPEQALFAGNFNFKILEEIEGLASGLVGWRAFCLGGIDSVDDMSLWPINLRKVVVGMSDLKLWYIRRRERVMSYNEGVRCERVPYFPQKQAGPFT